MKHTPGFIAIVEEAMSRVTEIDTAGYSALLAAGTTCALVDVREDSEWAASHAAGAIHLGKGIIERDIETRIPDTDTQVILYCGGGYRSALAADAIQKMGYKNVRSLAGGWRAWNAAALPVEK